MKRKRFRTGDRVRNNNPRSPTMNKQVGTVIKVHNRGTQPTIKWDVIGLCTPGEYYQHLYSADFATRYITIIERGNKKSMTPAQTEGFKVGEQYEVVNCTISMARAGIKVGDMATFVLDDASYCPKFRVGSIEFYATIPMPSKPVGRTVRIVPRSEHKEKSLDRVSLIRPIQTVDTLASGNYTIVTLPIGKVGHALSTFQKGGVEFTVFQPLTSDSPLCVRSAWLERVPEVDPKAVQKKIQEIEAENASIDRQLERMRKRIERKIGFRNENVVEILKLKRSIGQ